MSLCSVLRLGALATSYEGVTIASVYSNFLCLSRKKASFALFRDMPESKCASWGLSDDV
jgi:hypothetical protein